MTIRKISLQICSFFNYKQLLCLCCLFSLCAYSQDTIYTQDLIQVVSYEEWLDRQLEEQGRQLYRRDSLQKDSLYKDLVYRDSLLTAQLCAIKDSIARMRPTMPEEIRRIQDSIEQDKQQVIHALSNRERKIELDIAPALFYDEMEDVQEISAAIRQRNSYWRKDINLSLHFTQNYISSNWYKGGNSSIAMLGIQKVEVSYQKDKLSWYNLAEWRLGMTTVAGDSLRKYNFTDDLFRIYSKVGYKIYNQLDVSSSVDFQTNFFNVWNANQHTAKTAPLTPIKLNLTLGLDWKPVKNLSIMVSPLAYKMVYAFKTDSNLVDVTNYGIARGKDITNIIGSSMRLTYKWQPLREIYLDTEFYCYTDYRKVEIDWEINCNFILTRFMSVRLSLHPRYDNTVKSDDNKAHLQFKELLSLGFAHHFW